MKWPTLMRLVLPASKMALLVGDGCRSYAADLVRVDQVVRPDRHPFEAVVMLADPDPQESAACSLSTCGGSSRRRSRMTPLWPGDTRSSRSRLLFPVVFMSTNRIGVADSIGLDGPAQATRRIGHQAARASVDALQGQVVPQAGRDRVAAPDVPGQLGIAEVQDAGLDHRQVGMTRDLRGQAPRRAHDHLHLLAPIEQLPHQQPPRRPACACDECCHAESPGVDAVRSGIRIGTPWTMSPDFSSTRRSWK